MENFYHTLIEQTAGWSIKGGSAILICLIFWLAANLISRAIIKSSRHLKLNSHLIPLIARTFRLTLFLIGFITALGTLGINVTAIVAGLGLTGFALGFALKDTVSNLVAGILILLYQPFETGDKIKISDFEGTVTSIDLRYTVLESKDHKVLIPNSKLFTDPIMVHR